MRPQGMRGSHGQRSFAALVLLALAACAAHDETPVAPDRPARPAQDNEAGTPSESRPPRSQGAEPVRGLLLDRGTRKLANGLVVVAIDSGQRELCRLHLSLRAGPAFDPEQRPGLAEWTARSLLVAARSGPTGHRIATLGGELSMTVDDERVGLVLVGPRAKLGELASLLLTVVGIEVPDRGLYERELGRLRQERAHRRDERLRLWQLRRTMGYDDPTPVEQEESLASLIPAMAALFASRYHRPDGAFLIVDAEAVDAAQLDDLAERFSSWRSGAVAPEPRRSGTSLPLTFAESDEDLAEVVLILPDPDPARGRDPRAEVAWQLLCLDGLGGILRERLDAEGAWDLVPEIRARAFAGRPLRMLSFRLRPALVGRLLAVLGPALARLRGEEPGLDALRDARRRARLAWDARLSRPGGAAEVVELALRFGGGAGIDEAAVQAIDAARAADIPEVARRWAHASVLVRGPASVRPEGAQLIPRPEREARPITLAEPIEPLTIDAEARAAKAAEALAAAVTALGGAAALAPEGKARREARVLVESSLPYREDWSVDLGTGAAERTRTILATVLRTYERDGKVFEEVDGVERELGEGEAGLFRIEALADPRVLLTTVLREQVRLVLAGRIRAGGRPHLALDLSLHGHRLRLVVDEQNGLPRRLEYDEWQAGRPAQHVTLLFEAYDQRGRRLGPDRVSRYVEGEFRSELRY